jgi:Tfp pilus assembly protein PilN
MNRVEFNLLPDLKMERVKTTRTRKTVFGIAFLACAASLAVLALLFFTAYIVQKTQLSSASKDIAAANQELKKTAGLQEVLTVQNQLKTIPKLHQEKHIVSRLFTYLPQVTPTNVSINSIIVDFAANTIQISGTADSHHAVNTFIDTLKFTKYTVVNDNTPKDAFPVVIESNFTISGNQVTYQIDIQYDPVLFSNKQAAPVLQVPALTTTRSVVDNPSNLLFTNPAVQPKEGQ